MRTLLIVLVSLFAVACESESSADGMAGGGGGEDEASASPTASLQETLEGPEVARVYRAMMDTLAPDRGWERTRYLQFDWVVSRGSGALRRSHRWDVWGGRYRLEAPAGDDATMVAVFDVQNPTEGEQIWLGGEEVTDPARSDSLARQANATFINDSYWLLMPFKWTDPGVRTEHLGRTTMDDWGGTYEVVELTFEDVGLTPQNKYRAFVNPQTGVMELWQHFRNADDSEPSFTMAWTDWRDYGPILLSSRRENPDGEARIWFENLRAETEVPSGMFEGPDGA